MRLMTLLLFAALSYGQESNPFAADPKAPNLAA
jgi:hypothetical protein